MKNSILRSESALFYECAYSCDNAIFLSLNDKKYFITDGRYTKEAEESIKNAEIIESRELAKTARKLIRNSGIKKIVIDPKEWSYSELDLLTSKLPFVSFTHQNDYSQINRAIKTADEIALISSSVKQNAYAFDSFANYISSSGAGLDERRLHFEATRFLSDQGARALSFDPIFAINANAAKPHALPTDTTLKEGDLVLFDAGVKHKRWCSDRTRTALFGKNGVEFGLDQKFADLTMQKVYDLVLKAHNEAIKCAKSGMKAKELDAVARRVITDAGYGKFFNHSLGHGVGLDIHEYPFINSKSDFVLQDGMVFTIEPGIYLPDLFGVRIESIVVLDSGKARVL